MCRRTRREAAGGAAVVDPVVKGERTLAEVEARREPRERRALLEIAVSPSNQRAKPVRPGDASVFVSDAP